MPTKDKTKAKEQAKLRMQRYRKGVTSGRNNNEGVTLKDSVELPLERIEAIDKVLAFREQLGLENDTTERYSRAIEYRHWEISGNNNCLV